MLPFPFLKFLIVHSASLDRRARRFVENSFASARIWSRYFGSTTLSYSREVSSAGSRSPASANIDRSTPLAQRVDASLGAGPGLLAVGTTTKAVAPRFVIFEAWVFLLPAS